MQVGREDIRKLCECNEIRDRVSEKEMRERFRNSCHIEQGFEWYGYAQKILVNEVLVSYRALAKQINKMIEEDEDNDAE